MVLGSAIPQPAGVIVGAILGFLSFTYGFIGGKLSQAAVRTGQMEQENLQGEQDFRSANKTEKRPNIINETLLSQSDSSSGEAAGPTSTSSAVTLEVSDVSQVA